MKAIFKEYIGSEHLVKRNFTAGKDYNLKDAKFGFYMTQDDKGKSLIFQNGVDYMFELVDECKSIDNLIPSFKFFINGYAVSKVKFDDTLLCVKDFKSDGIDTSSIKFEVKFE